MPNYTSKLNLVKPIQGVDKYDVNEFNANADKIDQFATNIDLEKVDKVDGKGLSTEDYTTGEKAKVANLPLDTNSKLADIDGRIDTLITTPVPVGEIIVQEIIDARQGEVSVGAKVRAIDEQLADNEKKREIDESELARKSINLVDPSTITNNKAMDIDGSLFTVSGYYVTDYIKLNGKNISGLWLTSAVNPQLAVYDKTLKFIRTVISGTATTYNYQPGDYYVRVVFRTSITPISNAMINYGSTRLPYTSYREQKTSLSNVLYVGTQNGCDYKTIQEALDTITDDTVSNPYIIFVMPGIYERFSMIKPVNRLRYISLIGFDRVTTIVKSVTGAYLSPPAEIWTNGTIENITFEMKTSAGTYTGVAGQQAYAVHQDFGTSETLYKNCVMKSNAGPAGGFGTYQNGKLMFHNCEFITDSDNTFGTNTLGAMFIHTNSVDPDLNQYAEFKNCNGINQYGVDGFRLRVVTPGLGTYKILVQNCGSFGVNGASAFVNAGILDPKSFGNNVASLNA